MTSNEIREWFTPARLAKLDLQKMEDLAGINRNEINSLIGWYVMSIEDCKAITPLLKMIENGFNDCNK